MAALVGFRCRFDERRLARDDLGIDRVDLGRLLVIGHDATLPAQKSGDRLRALVRGRVDGVPDTVRAEEPAAEADY
ncbi:hypothetical protein GCM10010409_28400 [Mycolicibacterium diernhoferi]